MGVLKKRYISSFCDQAEAAKVYDIHAILTQGLKVFFWFWPKKAKTNFSYTKAELIYILQNHKIDLWSFPIDVSRSFRTLIL